MKDAYGLSEFDRWMSQVYVELADCDVHRENLPYKLHQWWELWDHGIPPQDAANAAILLAPAEIKPWPQHVAYTTN